MNPPLTIVTPTLNSGATLPFTLASLVALRKAGCEHIVVDSGSTDGTVALAEAAGARVIQFPKGNIYAAINAGMKEAGGEWLTYINGDDLLYADAVMDRLGQWDGNASLIYGNIDYIDAVGRFLFGWRSPQPRHLSWLMKHYCPFPQQGTLFRRETFARMGGFNESYRFSADYDFFCRCCARGEIFAKYKDRSVASFRLMPSQMSQRLSTSMAPEGEAIRAGLRGMDGFFAVMASRRFATAYRWATNVDSMLLRALRGRNQDAGWRR